MEKYKKIEHLADGGISELDLVMLPDGQNAVLRRLQPLHLLNLKHFFMFRRGIKLRATLPYHKNIISSFSYGFDGITPAELIEYVPGNNLKTFFNQRSPFLHTHVYEILTSAASGLAFVHSHGLKHLDVKPENFMLRTGNELVVKLTDFDLTRRADDMAKHKQQGTPAYMAPEQLKYHLSSQASDVFAFCVMAYTFLGGHPPFSGDSRHSTLKHQASGHIAAKPLNELNSSVPAAWCNAIMGGLEKRPENRISNMQTWLGMIQGN